MESNNYDLKIIADLYTAPFFIPQINLDITRVKIEELVEKSVDGLKEQFVKVGQFNENKFIVPIMKIEDFERKINFSRAEVLGSKKTILSEMLDQYDTLTVEINCHSQLKNNKKELDAIKKNLQEIKSIVDRILLEHNTNYLDIVFQDFQSLLDTNHLKEELKRLISLRAILSGSEDDDFSQNIHKIFSGLEKKIEKLGHL